MKRTSNPSPQKIAAVSSLRDLVSSAKSIAVVDYTGMKVPQITQLRREIKAAGGSLLVTKNTFFQIAAGMKNLTLSGLNAFVFCTADEITPLKVIAGFIKKNQKPVFKAGVLGDRVLSADEITRLSSLPDRKTNYQQLVSSVNTPLFRLVYSLNWNIGKLVRTLEAVKQRK